METEAKKRGFKVVKNLGGHGIGRSLHEQPDEIKKYKMKILKLENTIHNEMDDKANNEQ